MRVAQAKPWVVVSILVGFLIAETVRFAQVISQNEVGLGGDYLFYRGFGETWLETGQWYLPRQFEPHEFAPMEDNLFPPTALPLFVAGAIAPWPLWWLVPVLVLGYCIYRWRPSPLA
jgi:hypothetical protein